MKRETKEKERRRRSQIEIGSLIAVDGPKEYSSSSNK